MDAVILFICFCLLYVVLKFEYNFDLLRAIYDGLVSTLDPGPLQRRGQQ
jgi:hypothetical protein